MAKTLSSLSSLSVKAIHRVSAFEIHCSVYKLKEVS
jgi:hypothetical protein